LPPFGEAARRSAIVFVELGRRASIAGAHRQLLDLCRSAADHTQALVHHAEAAAGQQRRFLPLSRRSAVTSSRALAVTPKEQLPQRAAVPI
jgi:hypothetical protein